MKERSVAEEGGRVLSSQLQQVCNTLQQVKRRRVLLPETSNRTEVLPLPCAGRAGRQHCLLLL